MMSADEKLAPSERHKYWHGGRVIYEWDQSISDVNIYLKVPPGVRGKDLQVDINPRHLAVGIRGNPPYLDRDLGGAIKPSESYWTLEDSCLHLELTKAEEAGTWASALAGHELAAADQQADQKRLLLERFQKEHPGFDFSGAEFTGGSVPDPRTFMRDLEPPSR